MLLQSSPLPDRPQTEQFSRGLQFPERPPRPEKCDRTLPLVHQIRFHCFRGAKIRGLRLIFDLSFLNRFLKPASLRLRSVEKLMVAILRLSWLAMTDLRYAYCHVPIAPNFHPYLAFTRCDRFFQFRAMPFCLSTAPSAFTGLMNFPFSLLRQQGIHCFVYLDDWLAWAESRKECVLSLRQSLRLLISLGFLSNREKSVLTPNRLLYWPGVEIDAYYLR